MAGRPRNEQARQRILRAAADVASAQGLDGLSIAGLATELGLSKSGLFGYFGSKRELQLATIRRAGEVYVEQVIAPAADAPAGLARLWALCLRWLSYSRRRVFPGGCFFFAVMAEFDARSGPVHDAIAEASRLWTDVLTRQIEHAVGNGELTEGADRDQLAFELIALLETANAMSVLHGGEASYARALTGVRSRLLAAGAQSGVLDAVLDAFA